MNFILHGSTTNVVHEVRRKKKSSKNIEKQLDKI